MKSNHCKDDVSTAKPYSTSQQMGVADPQGSICHHDGRGTVQSGS